MRGVASASGLHRFDRRERARGARPSARALPGGRADGGPATRTGSRPQVAAWRPAFAGLVEGRRRPGVRRGRRGAARGGHRIPTSTSSSTPWSAPPGSMRRWRRCGPASGSRSPTRNRWSWRASWWPRRRAQAAASSCRWTRSTARCCSASPGTNGGLARLILTASGGPFRAWDAGRGSRRRPWSEALNHPTWRMGSKITVDSATLANKALEVIEAHFLFGLALRPARCRRAPAEHRARLRRVLRRQRHGAGRLSHDGAADPVRAHLPGRGCRMPGTRRFDPVAAGTADLRAGAGARCSARFRSVSRRAGPVAPRRPSSTRPTKRPWQRSWPAASVRSDRRSDRVGARRGTCRSRCTTSRPCEAPTGGPGIRRARLLGQPC